MFIHCGYVGAGQKRGLGVDGAVLFNYEPALAPSFVGSGQNLHALLEQDVRERVELREPSTHHKFVDAVPLFKGEMNPMPIICRSNPRVAGVFPLFFDLSLQGWGGVGFLFGHRNGGSRWICGVWSIGSYRVKEGGLRTDLGV